MSDESLPADTKDPRVEAALRDYLERLDRGEPVGREDFLQQHAEIAGALRSFIDAEAELRKLAAGAGQRESAGVSTLTFAAPAEETVQPKMQSDPPIVTTGRGLTGRFGRYEIIRAVGRGAMGAVYLAQDTQLERKVAIKTPHFEDDPRGELLARFYREARAAATLRNANICPVYDVGQIDDKHFISMAYIEGKPLSELIKSGKAQNERQIVTAIRKLALALQEAHDHGIVHRDLKPANIMVDKKGEPVIMDFGLARRRRAEGEASITRSGDLVGSPAYMSPEQIEGDPDNVGPASDQYSLGVVLYEMLTGQIPFRGSVINVLAQILTKDLTPPGGLRPGLDPRIETVCLRMMAKKAADRFPSMKAVATELAAIVKNSAAASSTAERPPTASRAPAAPAQARDDAGASQIRKSVREKALTESDLTSLEELVRKCLRRRDYDQAIQIIERIPQDRRDQALQVLLQKAREKVDEITFLLCEIDEADRLEDGQTALKKADELLKIQPAHHRAREMQAKYAGYKEGRAVRIGPKAPLIPRWDDGGWIPWSALAFGLTVVGVVAGVIIIWLGRTAIVIDAKDPGITVEVNDRQVAITAPGEQSIKVEPGDQTVKVSYAGFETVTRSFTLAKGKSKRLTVQVVDKKLVADLQGEILPLLVDSEKPKTVAMASGEAKGSSSVASGQAVTAATKNQNATNPAIAGFLPLFNGKDLTGWNAVQSEHVAWEVEADGTLSGRNSARRRGRRGFLVTARADYSDFHLRCEAMLSEGPNSGGIVFRRDPGDLKRGELADYLLFIAGTQQPRAQRGVKVTGSVLVGHENVLADPLAKAIERPVRAGQWFQVDLIAEGPHIQVTINGLPAVDVVDPNARRSSGAIGFVCRPDSVVRFRKVEIKELTPQGAATPVRENDPDGRAAEWVLSIGGTIKISERGSEMEINAEGALPSEAFELTVVNLGGNPKVTSTGLAVFKDSRNLRRLDLANTKVSDTGLAYLKDCKLVESLRLSGTQVSDAGLAHFKDSKKLTELSLDGTAVTDVSLERLAGLSKLKSLSVKKTHVTRAGIEKLVAILPECKIEWDGEPNGPKADLAAASEAEFVPLFNGKDLSGWTAIDNGGSWTVDNQKVLIGQGSEEVGKPLILIVDQGSYKDFELAIQILNAETSALQVVIRRSAVGNHYSGYGIAATDIRVGTRRVIRRGSIYRVANLMATSSHSWDAPAKASQVGAGEWYTLKITAVGKHIKSAIDGAVVADYEDHGRPFETGGIALILRSDKAVHIRQIKIKKLTP
jgi:serine/threonine protein kinase